MTGRPPKGFRPKEFRPKESDYSATPPTSPKDRAASYNFAANPRLYTTPERQKEEQERKHNTKSKESIIPRIPGWKKIKEKLGYRSKNSDEINLMEKISENEIKAKNAIEDAYEIYHEWIKNGKRLHEYEHMSFTKTREFITRAMNYGMLESRQFALEVDAENNDDSNKIERINKEIEMISHVMDEIYQSLEENHNEAIRNSIDWNKLFDKYRQDGNILHSTEGDKGFHDTIHKINSEDIYISNLQETALKIGQYQKLLNKTNDNKYKVFMDRCQTHYNEIILSEYQKLIGKELNEEDKEYISSWRPEDHRESEDYRISNDYTMYHYAKEFTE